MGWSRPTANILLKDENLVMICVYQENMQPHLSLKQNFYHVQNTPKMQKFG